MHADGRVEHRTQFLQATPGVDPCVPFLRELHHALGGDDVTIFRWAMHENSVLNQLRARLLADPSPPHDADALVAFVESITTRKADDGTEIAGARTVVDLCRPAERYYFHPSTQGSSSLKKVLPALMDSSPVLREMYGAPTYGGAGMPSLNLTQGFAWWVAQDGRMRDPYDLLPKVFADVPTDEIAAVDEALASELQNGGAAMAAYARLQFEDLEPAARAAIEKALLRYCELDTLPMVMAVQAWTFSATEAGA